MAGTAAGSCSADKQTDRQTKFQSFPSLLGLRRAVGESSFSGRISWGVSFGTPCWLCLCLFFSEICKTLLVHSNFFFFYHFLVLGSLRMLHHLKATFHPRGQRALPRWAGCRAGRVTLGSCCRRETEKGREQLPAKGQEVLTGGTTPGPHVCLDVIWNTSPAEMG